MIDEIPALAWSCLPDGSGEFLNKQWLDYTGLSTEAARRLHFIWATRPFARVHCLDFERTTHQILKFWSHR